MATKERKAPRDHILVDFQFYINNKSEEIFKGMTINVSQLGFGFVTERSVSEGQSITITKLTIKNAMHDFTGQRAKVIWVKQGRLYVEAGVKFNSDTRIEGIFAAGNCYK